MRTIREINDLSGVTVLVRAPLNEPVEDGHITNDFRLRRALPTIEFLTRAGAKVVVCGHVGRDPSETLRPIYEAFAKRLPHVSFSPEAIGPGAQTAVAKLAPGEALMLENLRRYEGEKGNDPAFARELAKLADMFVQDAFDTCHRKHASIVGLPQFLPTYAGLLLAEEVEVLSAARTPKHPALAIIGGAKFVTKEPVLKTLLGTYDQVAVAGALANDFLVAKGYDMRASLVSGADQAAVRTLLANAHLILPTDALAAEPDANVSAAHALALDAIPAGEAVLDAGPKTQATLATFASSARAVLWNGPLGHYENGFTDGTKALAQAIAGSDAHSVVGGGDTVAAIEELGLADQFSFISTGGGAMLDLLAHGTLPGIDAIPA